MLEKVPKNEKPRSEPLTHPQGNQKSGNSNSTTNGQLKDSRSRYDKGMELYREGKVKVGSNGLFKVSGYYEADTEKMTCTCPDYRTRKESCKHLFAAMLFVKNRGKQTIEHLEGQGNCHAGVRNGKDIGQRVAQSTESERSDSKVHHDAPEAKETGSIGGTSSKPFDRQATITRLAVLNTATEILKTHRTPLEPETVISVATLLEAWALGREVQHEG